MILRLKIWFEKLCSNDDQYDMMIKIAFFPPIFLLLLLF